MYGHPTGEGKFIHKDRGKREPRSSSFWRGAQGVRRKFTAANVIVIIMINVIFLANLSNFLGSAFTLPRNVHHMKVLYVDYDNNSPVSQALYTTYNELRGNGFPTLLYVDSTDYPTPESLQHAVCKNTQIWGAIYTHSGASDRLSAAIDGTSNAYNASDAISYIWNSVRYTPWALGEVSSSLQELITVTNSIYEISNSDIFSSANLTSPAAISALAQPFTPSAIDLMPTLQGVRVFLNTVLVVMTIVSQFFFTMALNGVATGFGLFTRLTLRHNMAIRFSGGLIYSSCLGATITGLIWAFRDGWDVTASQGVETWLVYTWICNIHFLVFDTAAGFIPVTYLPLFVLTWVLTNVTSAVVPFELAPGFYHWQYAMPAHEAYSLLITIWSRGCAPQLSIALPVMFTWWILGFVGSWLSMVKKCNDATVFEKGEEQIEKDVEKSDLELKRGKINGAEEEVKKCAGSDSGDSVDGNDAATVVAMDDTSNPSALLRKITSSKEGSRLARVPDSLWLATPIPFQESLGLTTTLTRSSRRSEGGMAR